ncbi:Uncharacterised protein [Escherichia coli]|uniref:Uncharacterized protein n=1 Tax=Escherichia coli TaxID=562 RepID=A0A376UAS1_ECOLX|nr:Uncharacterised protein [Escherichia coli]
MRRNGQEAVIDQRFTAISIPCIEHRMACIMDHFSVFIVTCNQHIDLVAGITVISMIKDKKHLRQNQTLLSSRWLYTRHLPPPHP